MGEWIHSFIFDFQIPVDDSIELPPSNTLNFSLFPISIHPQQPAMPASENTPRLEFLNKSAALLVSGSPSTSAHLLAVHNQVLCQNFRSPTDRHHERFCGACGSIRMPESTKIDTVSARKGKSATKESRDGVLTVYTCLRCDRSKIQRRRREAALQGSPSATRLRTLRHMKTTATTAEPPRTNDESFLQNLQSGEHQQASKTSENASSKKRVKTRKQSSLQSLLASKQHVHEPKPPSSLHLFDFLQQ